MALCASCVESLADLMGRAADWPICEVGPGIATSDPEPASCRSLAR